MDDGWGGLVLQLRFIRLDKQYRCLPGPLSGLPTTSVLLVYNRVDIVDGGVLAYVHRADVGSVSFHTPRLTKIAGSRRRKDL